jgi:AI-2 transport protein TqsA
MPQTSKPALNFLLATASFVVIVAGMKAASSILVPFLMAAFIAVLSAPSYFWLEKRGIPSVLALIIVILGLAVVGLIVGALLGTSMNDFMTALPHYQQRLTQLSTQALGWLAGLGLDTSDENLRNLFDVGSVMRLAGNMLSGLSNLLTFSFLILLLVVFMLLEAASLPAKLRWVLDDPDHSLEGFQEIAANLKRYIGIKIWTSLGTGVFIGVFLKIIGVDFPVLWGMVAFLLNFVPNIGSIIATIPAVLLSLIDGGGSLALMTVAGYVGVNVLFGNILEVRFMGQGVGLSVLVVFLSLIFWGWVFGTMGMILAVPLTMMFKIVLDSREETRWLAVLLGSEAPVRAARAPAGAPAKKTTRKTARKKAVTKKKAKRKSAKIKPAGR